MKDALHEHMLNTFPTLLTIWTELIARQLRLLGFLYAEAHAMEKGSPHKNKVDWGTLVRG